MEQLTIRAYNVKLEEISTEKVDKISFSGEKI